MKKTIVPSIIAKSQKELNERIRKVKDSKLMHLDIMDGKFVKNKSLFFNFQVPKNKKYEAHLMVKNPGEWVKKNWSKVNTIIFHLESCEDESEVKDLIKLIKSKKRKAGIAINPRTSINKVKPYLKNISMVLIMMVTPGKYGSRFLPNNLKKIKQLRKLKSNLNIEVDGGISLKTIKTVNKAGANSFVSGSYIQNNKNPKKAIKKLQELIR